MEERVDIDPRRLEELRRRALRGRIRSGGSREAETRRIGNAGSAAMRPDELQRRALREFIATGLTSIERTFVLLQYVEGMTTREISATLDLSESSVDKMRRSIFERIRTQAGRMLAIESSAGCPKATAAYRPSAPRKHHVTVRRGAGGKKRLRRIRGKR